MWDMNPGQLSRMLKFQNNPLVNTHFYPSNLKSRYGTDSYYIVIIIIHAKRVLKYIHKIQTVRVMISAKNEYDQEIPQSHTADQAMEPPGRATEHL